jgi:hypothetical protein
VITHLLTRVPYKDIEPAQIKIPPRQKVGNYVRPPIDSMKWIPRVYPGALGNQPAEVVPYREPFPVKEKRGKKDKGKSKKKKK